MRQGGTGFLTHDGEVPDVALDMGRKRGLDRQHSAVVEANLTGRVQLPPQTVGAAPLEPAGTATDHGDQAGVASGHRAAGGGENTQVHRRSLGGLNVAEA